MCEAYRTVETSLACASDYGFMHWSQTESSKWSLKREIAYCATRASPLNRTLPIGTLKSHWHRARLALHKTCSCRRRRRRTRRSFLCGCWFWCCCGGLLLLALVVGGDVEEVVGRADECVAARVAARGDERQEVTDDAVLRGAAAGGACLPRMYCSRA
eukprot:scaffold92077_cov45-Phaeocystis_antarctica.AAC.1